MNIFLLFLFWLLGFLLGRYFSNEEPRETGGLVEVYDHPDETTLFIEDIPDHEFETKFILIREFGNMVLFKKSRTF